MAENKRSESRLLQIVKAAEKVFAKNGFQETTISDVAKEAGLSEPTIYEYFKSKEELLFSIPIEPLTRSRELLSYHLNYISGAGNKLRSVIYHLLNFYYNNPDHASVVLLILKVNRRYLNTESYNIVRDNLKVIIEIINEGIASGEFKTETDPYMVRSIIMGAIDQMVTTWLLLGSKKGRKEITEYVDPLYAFIINSIGRKDRAKELSISISLAGDDDVKINGYRVQATDVPPVKRRQ